MEATRIAVVGDIHLGASDDEAVLDELDRVVDGFDAWDPATVIVTGDLVEDRDPETDERNVRRVVETLDAADAPVRYLAGNHDAVALDTGTLADLFGNDLWGHESVGGVDLVYLDTSSPHLERSRAEVSEPQLAMLDDVLPASEGALVFAHHPVHYHDVTDNAWFGEHPELAFPGNKARVTRRFEEHGTVLATVNGHLHELHHERHRETDHFTLNAFNKEHPESEGVTGTHALISVGDERLSVEVHDSGGFVRELVVPRR